MMKLTSVIFFFLTYWHQLLHPNRLPISLRGVTCQAVSCMCWRRAAVSFSARPCEVWAEAEAFGNKSPLSPFRESQGRNTRELFLSPGFKSWVECHTDRKKYTYDFADVFQQWHMNEILSSSCLKISWIYLVSVLSKLISSVFFSNLVDFHFAKVSCYGL